MRNLFSIKFRFISWNCSWSYCDERSRFRSWKTFSKKRTFTGIVTASASVGYFVPFFTKYGLIEFGWQNTLVYYLYLLQLD